MQEKDTEQKAADEALRKLRRLEYVTASQVSAQMKNPFLDKLFISPCFTSSVSPKQASDFHYLS